MLGPVDLLGGIGRRGDGGGEAVLDEVLVDGGTTMVGGVEGVGPGSGISCSARRSLRLTLNLDLRLHLREWIDPVGMELGGHVQGRHGGELVRPGVDVFDDGSTACTSSGRQPRANPTDGRGSTRGSASNDTSFPYQDEIAIKKVHGHANDLAIVAKVIDDSVGPFADLGAPLVVVLALPRSAGGAAAAAAAQFGQGLQAKGRGVHVLASEHGP